jgi:hypothetical protein
MVNTFPSPGQGAAFNHSRRLARKQPVTMARLGPLCIGISLALGAPGLCQSMGAVSTSTGTMVVPLTTTGFQRSFYGTRSLNSMGQGSALTGGYAVPSYSFSLPELPRPLQPEPPISSPKPFEPDLGSFEANR